MLSFYQNGKTIRDLRINPSDSVLLTKHAQPHIPEAELCNNEGKLTPNAKIVFCELFDEFSTQGLMNRE